MTKQRPKHAKTQDATMESRTPKEAFVRIKEHGLVPPPVWSVIVTILLLAIFGFVGYQVATEAGWTIRLNEVVSARIQGLRSPELSTIIVPLTMIGNVAPMVVICVVVMIILAIRRHWDEVLFVSTSIIVGVLIVQILKRLFAVSRPAAETLVALPASFSFPSGHTSCSLIVLGFFGLMIVRRMGAKGTGIVPRILVLALFIVLAICIGLSRIYVGVHWPTDVLGGWLFGAAWLILTGAFYLRNGATWAQTQALR